jgi:hypothetical protein
MMYRTIMLTIAALSTTQASAGDLPGSVVVSPGAFYIGSAHIYVTPSPKYEPYAAPTYDPGYYPGNTHKSYYHGVGPYYGSPRHVAREPVYSPYGGREPGYPPYAVEYAPRPPASVPYNGRCYIDPTYGRVAYCN